MNKLYATALGVLILYFPGPARSQTSAGGGWTVKPSQSVAFVENKGQLDRIEELKGKTVLYTVTEGNTQMFFTPRGLIFLFTQVVRESGLGIKKPGEEHGEEMAGIRTSVMEMEWVDGSSAASVVAEDRLSAYFNYGRPDGSSISFVPGYRKLIYKGMYPGVDIEYTIHAKGGVEYSLILHPGADVSKIKMRYTGADKISLGSNGSLLYEARGGSIQEHAPLTFYEDSSLVSSGFKLSGNEVSFHLGKYDNTRKVIVDPWIQPLATMIKGYDIEKDGAGNVYVYGGNAVPYYLQKYDPAGVLQWTYSPPFGAYYGDLAVDQPGSCYLSEGCCTGQLNKVSTAGVSQWLKYVGNYELWSLAFNCGSSQLSAASFDGGTIRLNTINKTTGNVSFSSVLSTNEVRSMNVAPNGKLYSVTADFLSTGGSGNFLVGRTATFAPMFNKPSGYLIAETSPAFNTAQFGGMNLVAANNCRAYTTDGITLKKWDAASGTLLGSVVITGGAGGASNMLNAGIAIDSCENIFVGSGSGVVQYNAALVQLNFIPTPGTVFCVNIGNNGELLVSGQNFAGAFAANACNGLPCATSFSLSTNALPGTCNNDGTATVNTLGGTSPFTYTWSTTPVQTTATATGLNPGTYTVTVTQSCGPTLTASVTVPTCNTVPLRLLSFDAVRKAAGVMLTWEINQESNPVAFEIERSTDGLSFLSAGSQQEPVKTGATLLYSFTDRQAPAGRVYYRVKALCSDGSLQLSHIIPISSAGEENRLVFLAPNPVRTGEDITLKYKAQKAGKVLVAVADLMGREAHRTEISVREGLSTFKIPNQLGPGIYYLKIQSGEGIEMHNLVVE
jgi:hypothetical protein